MKASILLFTIILALTSASDHGNDSGESDGSSGSNKRDRSDSMQRSTNAPARNRSRSNDAPDDAARALVSPPSATAIQLSHLNLLPPAFTAAAAPAPATTTTTAPIVSQLNLIPPASLLTPGPAATAPAAAPAPGAALSFDFSALAGQAQGASSPSGMPLTTADMTAPAPAQGLTMAGTLDGESLALMQRLVHQLQPPTSPPAPTATTTTASLQNALEAAMAANNMGAVGQAMAAISANADVAPPAGDGASSDSAQHYLDMHGHPVPALRLMGPIGAPPAGSGDAALAQRLWENEQRSAAREDERRASGAARTPPPPPRREETKDDEDIELPDAPEAGVLQHVDRGVQASGQLSPISLRLWQSGDGRDHRHEVDTQDGSRWFRSIHTSADGFNCGWRALLFLQQLGAGRPVNEARRFLSHDRYDAHAGGLLNLGADAAQDAQMQQHAQLAQAVTELGGARAVEAVETGVAGASPRPGVSPRPAIAMRGQEAVQGRIETWLRTHWDTVLTNAREERDRPQEEQLARETARAAALSRGEEVPADDAEFHLMLFRMIIGSLTGPDADLDDPPTVDRVVADMMNTLPHPQNRVWGHWTQNGQQITNATEIERLDQLHKQQYPRGKMHNDVVDDARKEVDPDGGRFRWRALMDATACMPLWVLGLAVQQNLVPGIRTLTFVDTHTGELGATAFFAPVFTNAEVTETPEGMIDAVVGYEVNTVGHFTAFYEDTNQEANPVATECSDCLLTWAPFTGGAKGQNLMGRTGNADNGPRFECKQCSLSLRFDNVVDGSGKTLADASGTTLTEVEYPTSELIKPASEATKIEETKSEETKSEEAKSDDITPPVLHRQTSDQIEIVLPDFELAEGTHVLASVTPEGRMANSGVVPGSAIYRISWEVIEDTATGRQRYREQRYLGEDDGVTSLLHQIMAMEPRPETVTFQLYNGNPAETKIRCPNAPEGGRCQKSEPKHGYIAALVDGGTTLIKFRGKQRRVHTIHENDAWHALSRHGNNLDLAQHYLSQYPTYMQEDYIKNESTVLEELWRYMIEQIPNPNSPAFIRFLCNDLFETAENITQQEIVQAWFEWDQPRGQPSTQVIIAHQPLLAHLTDVLKANAADAVRFLHNYDKAFLGRGAGPQEWEQPLSEEQQAELRRTWEEFADRERQQAEMQNRVVAAVLTGVQQAVEAEGLPAMGPEVVEQIVRDNLERNPDITAQELIALKVQQLQLQKQRETLIAGVPKALAPWYGKVGADVPVAEVQGWIGRHFSQWASVPGPPITAEELVEVWKREHPRYTQEEHIGAVAQAGLTMEPFDTLTELAQSPGAMAVHPQRFVEVWRRVRFIGAMGVEVTQELVRFAKQNAALPEHVFVEAWFNKDDLDIDLPELETVEEVASL